jgi:hypothetical protein
VGIAVAALIVFVAGGLSLYAVTNGDDDRGDGSALEEAPAIEGDGTYLVGEDLAPGRYVADPPEGASCSWERQRSPEDTSGSENVIVGGGPGDGRFLVEVATSDHAFVSDGCGDWRPHEPPAQPSTTIPEGDWAVGEDVEPGAYVSEGGEACLWASFFRLRRGARGHRGRVRGRAGHHSDRGVVRPRHDQWVRPVDDDGVSARRSSPVLDAYPPAQP